MSRPITAFLLVILALAGCVHSDHPRERTAAGAAVPTAQDQSAAAGDVEITKRIRQSFMADERLNLAAKNVAIITSAGRVTLRGTVTNTRDKAELGTRAREIAGIDRVDNWLEVTDR